MTTKLPFTQAGLARAIAGAERAGKRVIGIKADGTILVDDGQGEHPRLDERDETPSKYRELGRD